VDIRQTKVHQSGARVVSRRPQRAKQRDAKASTLFGPNMKAVASELTGQTHPACFKADKHLRAPTDNPIHNKTRGVAHSERC
jgi:hypothetical protein